jgi:hypothetical protein
MKQLIIAAILAICTSGCLPWYFIERMQMDLEARRAYQAYCSVHPQECIDAYNRSMHVYVNQ